MRSHSFPTILAALYEAAAVKMANIPICILCMLQSCSEIPALISARFLIYNYRWTSAASFVWGLGGLCTSGSARSSSSWTARTSGTWPPSLTGWSLDRATITSSAMWRSLTQKKLPTKTETTWQLSNRRVTWIQGQAEIIWNDVWWVSSSRGR